MKHNKIYNMGVFDFLGDVAEKSVDLAIIDPPYNMSKAEWDKFDTHNSFMEFTEGWIDALIPKLKKDGSLYIFNTPFNCAYILSHLVKRGMIFQNWITWDKRDGMGGAKRKYSNRQESLLFFTESNKHTFNHNAIRIPYESTDRMKHAKAKGIIKNGKRWFPNPDGRLCGDVWHVTSERHKNKVNGKTQKLGHITPKPLDMIERIVKASSNKGDLVLDCFVGSGTTAVASAMHDRNFICNDADEKYCDIANARLAELERSFQ